MHGLMESSRFGLSGALRHLRQLHGRQSISREEHRHKVEIEYWQSIYDMESALVEGSGQTEPRNNISEDMELKSTRHKQLVSLLEDRVTQEDIFWSVPVRGMQVITLQVNIVDLVTSYVLHRERGHKILRHFCYTCIHEALLDAPDGPIIEIRGLTEGPDVLRCEKKRVRSGQSPSKRDIDAREQECHTAGAKRFLRVGSMIPKAYAKPRSQS